MDKAMLKSIFVLLIVSVCCGLSIYLTVMLVG